MISRASTECCGVKHTSAFCPHCGNSLIREIKKASDDRYAFGYLRKSKVYEGEDDPLEVQRINVLRYYEERLKPKGYLWGGIYEDRDVSASIAFAARSAGGILNRNAQRGDIIVVHKLDRAFRSLANATWQVNNWRQRGLLFKPMDLDFDVTTIEGELMMNMMAMLGEFERKRIAGRTKDRLEARKARGLPGPNNWVYCYRRRQAMVNKRGQIVPGYAYDVDRRKVEDVLVILRAIEEGKAIKQIHGIMETRWALRDGREPPKLDAKGRLSHFYNGRKGLKQFYEYVERMRYFVKEYGVPGQPLSLPIS